MSASPSSGSPERTAPTNATIPRVGLEVSKHDECGECRKPRSQHIRTVDALGVPHWFCYEFTTETSGRRAVAEFSPFATHVLSRELAPLFIEFEEAAFELGNWRPDDMDETHDEVRARFITARRVLFTAIAELEARV